MLEILSFAIFAIIFTIKTNTADYHMIYNELTAEEKRIIEDKCTEMPFTGKYWDFFEEGIYACRRCNLGLFSSEDKFKCGCGWPAFDDELYYAIKKERDADGKRIEIMCNRCNAHLGHIFYGEKLTPKNQRYCVNSHSLEFIPKENLETAYFAGGCFWGVEYYFLEQKGVLHVLSGYMGGTTENPKYKDVCSGKTGHAETVMILFDKRKNDFETLAKLFFEIHDPTQINRQGPDIGEQYRSEIFCVDENQYKIAEKLIGILEKKGLKIATKISYARKFFPAEDYHQRYYLRTGKTPYCHKKTKRFE